MNSLIYFSLVLVLIALIFYILYLLKKDDKSNNTEKNIMHDIAETKNIIPNFDVPNTQAKKITKNLREQQFTRSLNRILKIDSNNNDDKEPVSQDKVRIAEVPINSSGSNENTSSVVDSPSNLHADLKNTQLDNEIPTPEYTEEFDYTNGHEDFMQNEEPIIDESNELPHEVEIDFRKQKVENFLNKASSIKESLQNNNTV